jgi:hypothetical protein
MQRANTGKKRKAHGRSTRTLFVYDTRKSSRGRGRARGAPALKPRGASFDTHVALEGTVTTAEHEYFKRTDSSPTGYACCKGYNNVMKCKRISRSAISSSVSPLMTSCRSSSLNRRSCSALISGGTCLLTRLPAGPPGGGGPPPPPPPAAPAPAAGNAKRTAGGFIAVPDKAHPHTLGACQLGI